MSSSVATASTLQRGYFDTAIASFQLDGQLRGMPLWGGDNLIYCNRRCFERAARFHKRPVPLPSDDWTLEDFVRTAKDLTFDEDGDGRIDQFGFALPMWMYALPFLWAYGVDVLDPATNTRWDHDRPGGRAGLAVLPGPAVQLSRVPPKPVEQGEMDIDTAFFTGRICNVHQRPVGPAVPAGHHPQGRLPHRAYAAWPGWPGYSRHLGLPGDVRQPSATTAGVGLGVHEVRLRPSRPGNRCAVPAICAGAKDGSRGIRALRRRAGQWQVRRGPFPMPGSSRSVRTGTRWTRQIWRHLSGTAQRRAAAPDPRRVPGRPGLRSDHPTLLRRDAMTPRTGRVCLSRSWFRLQLGLCCCCCFLPPPLRFCWFCRHDCRFTLSPCRLVTLSATKAGSLSSRGGQAVKHRWLGLSPGVWFAMPWFIGLFGLTLLPMIASICWPLPSGMACRCSGFTGSAWTTSGRSSASPRVLRRYRPIRCRRCGGYWAAVRRTRCSSRPCTTRWFTASLPCRWAWQPACCWPCC